jgi:hypothetical protein
VHISSPVVVLLKEGKCSSKEELDIPEICIYLDVTNQPLFMADINPSSKQENWIEEPRKIPDTLNVLTILTFIGCGIFWCLAFFGFIRAQALYDSAVANQARMESMPDWLKGMQGPDPVGTALASLNNKVPIFLLTTVAYALCTYGAIQMRRLKKSGFTFYLVGELLPLLTGYLFIGASTVTGSRLVFSLLFIGLFIILYATQLKYMKK